MRWILIEVFSIGEVVAPCSAVNTVQTCATLLTQASVFLVFENLNIEEQERNQILPWDLDQKSKNFHLIGFRVRSWTLQEFIGWRMTFRSPVILQVILLCQISNEELLGCPIPSHVPIMFRYSYMFSTET